MIIRELIKKYGQEIAKKYLLEFFRKPENIRYFTILFPDHVGAKLPFFQKTVLGKVFDIVRLAIVAPRGSGKSTLINIPIMAWFLLYGHARFAVLVSNTLPQARLHLEALANELETNEYIKWLFGDVRGKVWGAEMLIVETEFGQSALVAKGAGQRIRGLKFRSFRPDLVILDDLEDEKGVNSQEQRDKLEKWFRFNLMRAMTRKRNRIIYIGTLLHEQALLTRIMTGTEPLFQGWDKLFFQAISEDGTSFWEDQFPLDYLKAIRDDPTHPDFIGEAVFDQEMMNKPRSEKDRIIKPEWIDPYTYSAYEKDEKWKKSLKIVSMVDPAISEKAESSDFAMQTFGIDGNGHYWHLNTVSGHFDYPAQITLLLDEYERWRHSQTGIESNAYLKVLSQAMKVECAKRGLYPNIKQVFTHKDKSVKMVSVSSTFQGGFVHLLREHPETPKLRDQLLSFPQGKNDSADALAMLLEMTQKKKRRTFAKKPNIF